MSTYCFINSLHRDVYTYGNSADFMITGNQTGKWNLIRSIDPSLPYQRSQNQYYNVKVCSLTLPMIPEVLQYPGIFLTFDAGDFNKNATPINHITPVESSGFPCTAARTLVEIADNLNVNVGDLTAQQIRKAREEDSSKFYSQDNGNLGSTTFFLVCDKLQFNEEGQAMWIQYKSYMDQVMPYNIQGNNIRFTVSDMNGKPLELTKWPGDPCTPNDQDLWDPCEETSPGNSMRQVYAMLEFTHLRHKFKTNV